MRRYVVVCLTLLLTPLGLLADGFKPEEQQRFADGLYGRQLFDMAIKEYEQILKRAPDYKNKDTILFRLGECFRKMGKLDKADTYYYQLLKDVPNSSFKHTAEFRRGELLASVGRYDEAIKRFQDLLNKKPSDQMVASALYYTALCLNKQDKKDQAEKHYKHLLEKYPQSPYASFAALELADLYKEKDKGKALELYKKVAGKPASARSGAEALFQLAEMSFMAQDYQTSADAYQKLLETYPKDARAGEARLQAAWSFFNSSGHERALKLVESELAKENIERPDEWLYLKANCLRNLKRREAAHQAYAALLEKFPTERFAEAATYEKALMEFTEKDYAAVIALLNSFAPTEALRKDAWWLLAESYAAWRQPYKAIEYYDQIVQTYPKEERAAQAAYRKAEVLQMQGQQEESAETYLKMVDAHPENELAPKALFAAAACQARLDRQDKSVKTWARLIKDYPQHELVEESLFRKGFGEFKLDKYAPATVALERLVADYPDSKLMSETLFWLAVIDEKTDKNDRAEARLRKALESGGTGDILNKIKFRLAAVLQKQNKLDEAANFVQELIETRAQESMPPELLEWLARHRLEQKQSKAAQVAAAMLVEQSSKEVWKQIGWYLMGMALKNQDLDVDAVKAFESAVQLEARTREGAEAALELGMLRLKEQQFDAARKALETAADWSLDDEAADIKARCYFGLGEISQADKKYEEAARYFLGVAILFDDALLSSESLYRAAYCFGMAGKPLERRRAATELLERYPESTWSMKIKEKSERSPKPSPEPGPSTTDPQPAPLNPEP